MTSQQPEDAERPHVAVAEADRRLGVTPEAVRLARKRGALEGFEVAAGSRIRRFIYTDSLSAFTPRARRRSPGSDIRSESGLDPVRLAAENASLRETNLMLLAAAEEDKKVRRHYVKAAEIASHDLVDFGSRCGSRVAINESC